MRDYKFYGVGTDPGRFQWAVTPARRVLRRLLRPVFYRQEELFEELGRSLDELWGHVARIDTEVQALRGQGWDQEALARRLAALEDRINAVLEDRANGEVSR